MAKKKVKTPKSTPLQIDITKAIDEHCNSVHDTIRKIDIRDAQSMAQAPFIAVSNATDGKK